MGKRILITDDAAFMRMMLKDILSKNGYEIAGEAENGKVAIELHVSCQYATVDGRLRARCTSRARPSRSAYREST
jgi:DNA-binding NarL/FixJ family response regulator